MRGVQAALMWGEEQNKIYLFEGNYYWKLNVNTNSVESIYPHSTSDWQGLPPSIDGAFQDKHGEFSPGVKLEFFWEAFGAGGCDREDKFFNVILICLLLGAGS